MLSHYILLYYKININKVTVIKDGGVQEKLSVKSVCLFAHNQVRSQYQDTPPLVWDQDLADEVSSVYLVSMSNAISYLLTRSGPDGGGN